MLSLMVVGLWRPLVAQLSGQVSAPALAVPMPSWAFLAASASSRSMGPGMAGPRVFERLDEGLPAPLCPAREQVAKVPVALPPRGTLTCSVLSGRLFVFIVPLAKHAH